MITSRYNTVGHTAIKQKKKKHPAHNTQAIKLVI